MWKDLSGETKVAEEVHSFCIRVKASDNSDRSEGVAYITHTQIIRPLKRKHTFIK